MTKRDAKRLLSLVQKADDEVVKARLALELQPVESAGTAAGATRRATRHSRDLAKRIDRAALALGKARQILEKDAGENDSRPDP